MEVGDLVFPPDFRWGTATAAHQVEGQLHNDWSEWEKIPGKIRDGSTSSDSCDWWAGRYHEDFDLAQGMANNALRLSVEWSRIEPREGEWDLAAIDRYRAMLNALRQKGIEPMVTLFHFTSPLWLISSGGWEANNVVARFERFAARCAEAFGDLVDLWCTINEPNVYATYSYLLGLWPPQLKSMKVCLRVLQNQLLAHAAAYHAIHRLQPSARVGLAQHIRIFDPLRPSSALDRWAAHVQDALFNRLVLDPPATGRLPFPLGLNQPVAGLADSQDFIGVNYYSRDMASFDITQPGLLFTRRFAMPGADFSMEGWGEIYPEGLYRCLKRLQAYDKPLYITEIGLPDNDDSKRPRFLVTHLHAVHRAVRDGIPVKGLYFWSLVDNFEWAEGFSARFGLVHLDLETKARSLKGSGRLYAAISRAGSVTAEKVREVAPEVLDEVFPRE